MDTATLVTILGILAIPLSAAATGLSIVIGIIMSRWAAREKTKTALIEASETLKLMKINGETAAKAVEQMYWDKPNSEKKALALQIAKQYNELAGIKVNDNMQLPMNEVGVSELPPSVVVPLG
jgi:hypothetical protein